MDSLVKAVNLSVFYGLKQAVHNVTLDITAHQVTALIGPSGCGKSTFLRCINRMNDFVDSVRIEGQILFKGQNIYDKKVDPVRIRSQIGMVFQKPNPFPQSIKQNIIWAPRLLGLVFDSEELVEQSLRRAALWDEVKDRLHDSALSLSGGQQQRLCIARAIALSPELILMDEPCSALDPKSTQKIELLISELSEKYTILIVTHNMQQAARVSDITSFFYEGRLIESGSTKDIFTKPTQKETEDYITGRFG